MIVVHRSILIASLALTAASCSAAEQPATANDAALPVTVAQNETVIAPWDASRCGDDDYQNARMERHPALMGVEAGRLEAAYGKPAQREDFRVGEPAGTFYGALGRRVSGAPHPDAGAAARVLTWNKSGCNFSVFFVERGGRWNAVNAFEWSPGADF